MLTRSIVNVDDDGLRDRVLLGFGRRKTIGELMGIPELYQVDVPSASIGVPLLSALGAVSSFVLSYSNVRNRKVARNRAGVRGSLAVAALDAVVVLAFVPAAMNRDIGYVVIALAADIALRNVLRHEFVSD
jgi:hypothetical protein